MKSLQGIFLTIVAVFIAVDFFFSGGKGSNQENVPSTKDLAGGSQEIRNRLDQQTRAPISQPGNKALSSFHKAAPPNIAPEAMGLDQNEYEEAKSNYFCDLARTARESCEKIQRDQQGHEQCLKLAGYYTHSRHCGHRP